MNADTRVATTLASSLLSTDAIVAGSTQRILWPDSVTEPAFRANSASLDLVRKRLVSETLAAESDSPLRGRPERAGVDPF
jgi:hypothetical protein